MRRGGDLSESMVVEKVEAAWRFIVNVRQVEKRVLQSDRMPRNPAGLHRAANVQRLVPSRPLVILTRATSAEESRSSSK